MKKNIVVIGAGIIGTSIAYHLAMRGIQDVVLIDKGDLDHNDGSTSHAPGGLRTLTPSKFFTKLGQASRAVYDKLPLAVDGEEQFFRTGMVQIANTEARFNSHKRLAEFGMMHGIEAHLLGPNEVADKLFLVDPKTVYGGIYIPDSGTVKTGRIATSMRREAEKSGHLISLAETEVIDVEVVNGRVTAIITSNPAHPRIDCEMAVLATNIWAPILANKVGMPMPLFPGEHQYIYTEPTDALNKVKETENTMPVTAFDDISVYFRQHNDRIGIGSYHHEARLVDPYKLGKEAKMPFTPEDFTEAWRLMQGHMPLLQNTNVSHGFNGMFAFTVDHYPIMGEAKVKGFWAAVGAWLSFASGVGEVMTRWMIDGDPGMDVRYADINRFHPHQLNHEFLSRQSKYFYEIGFDILHPNQVASSVRNLRFSPYHHQMEKLGGEFVPFASIETPYWYSSNQDLANKVGEQFPHRSGYDATAWTPIIGGEVHAMRESVGIVDWSAAIGPVEISGPKALEFLQTLCSSNIERPVGGVAYSLMLNVHGKIMRDVTILRKEENVFWLLTGKANLPSELYWIEQQAAGFTAEGSVKIVARGEEFVSIALWGPNARKVLEKVTHADVSNEAFPWYTAREIGIGMAPTTTVRISYVGELG
ncbi:MAG: FAD-dependent oxidoreductase, partial [Chloroflexota bacterium]